MDFNYDLNLAAPSLRNPGKIPLYPKEVVMTQEVINKYGIKMIPRTTKTRPRSVESLGADKVDVIKMAKQVIEEHKDVLAALAKR